MKFSREFIDKVRDANNIVDVVSRQVALKKSGGQYLGLCPFPDHKEKTPSFSVSESKQLYYCFGCKKAGNIFNFVEAIMGMNFPEAVEWLARQARIPIPEGTHADNQFRKSEDHEKRALLAINDFAAKYFSDELARSHSSDEIKDYLKARGISANTVKSFRLGYSLNHWDKLSNLMASHQIPLPKAESLGLIRHRKEGQDGYYDIFRHRLMFPILGLDGSCLGFGGRIIGEGEPKYLNSPESAVFHKGKIFYGLYESAKYIRAQDQVIVVEGYMDMLALFQAGIRNVVAPLGTALTSDQARLLKRFTRNVVMLFDGDSAGQMAVERSLPILLKEGLLPVGVTLPSDMDPDDFVQKYGASELQERISQAPELFILVMQRWMAGYKGSATEKIAVVDKASLVLNEIGDGRLRDLYMKELGERLGLENRWLRNAFDQGRSPHREIKRIALKDPSGESEQGEIDAERAKAESSSSELIKILGKRPKAEEQLVNLALMNRGLLVKIRESGITEKFSHSGLREVLHRIFLLYGQLPNEFDKLTSLMVSQVDAPEVLFQHLEKHLANLDSEGAQILADGCIRKVRDAFLRTQSRQIAVNLRGRSTSEQLERLEQIMNIQLDRRIQRADNEPS